ncbi:MAG: gliding motility-associated ABC transporter substrate-binding protein GldG [Bacteroidia bacterium]|nr:gliding motility-associated ABC transporter substrate-binding protein GldG [Bacteroidia bacterium]
MWKIIQKNIQLFLVIALLLVANLIASGYFYRFDLTKEKRYSLSDLTKSTVKTLDYPLIVTVFMEGDFPPNIRKFQDAVRTTLLEMKLYAGGNLEFEFVDPAQNPELMQLFVQKGYRPIPVKVRVSPTETKEQYMWPLAVMRSRDREVYVDLLRGSSIMTPQGPNVDFLKAEADLEYKLTASIRNLQKERGGVIALLQGHGELSVDQIPDLGREIQNSYNLYTYNLADVPNYEVSPSVDVLVILQPTRAFSERDKYEIDQYLIRGGSVLWVMDQEQVDMDMYRKQATLTSLYDLNLDDLFMKYGLKVNYDLIQDLESESTEVFQPGESGGTFLSKKWVFFPLIFNFPEHPINRNVDAVMLRYASSIDTFQRAGLETSVFLHTSPLSRTIQGRQFIDVNEYVQNPPPESVFNQPQKTAGVLVEGIFESLFNGRQIPLDSLATQPPVARFGPRNNPSAPGKMVVISDGEFVQGKLYREERGFLPYDNKILLMNAIDYLAGDEALNQIRSKEVVVRLINVEKARSFAGWIRVINIALPVLLVILFGLARFGFRRWKNEKTNA